MIISEGETKMKKKSPIGTYFLIWMTCGLYFLFWMASSMQSLNAYSSQTVFNVKSRMRNLQIVLGVNLMYQLMMFKLFSSGENVSLIIPVFFIGFIMSGFWLIIIVKSIYDISKAIEKIELDNKFADVINTGKTMGFIFLYFIAFPYLQKHMNTIYDTLNLKVLESV